MAIPANPITIPPSRRRVIRSPRNQALKGATQRGVVYASTEARPGGNIVNAIPVSAAKTANCNVAKVITRRQSL